MMNSTFSEIFHSPNVLDREKLSFAPATVKDLEMWAGNLSFMQLGDTSKSLFHAVLEISRLKCSETLRFDLIHSLHPTIDKVLASLEKHFFNQGPISTDRNEHIIELAMLLRCHFAGVYINIARSAHEQLAHQKFSLFAFNQKKNLSIARTLAIYYALQQLVSLLYQQQILYSHYFTGQWLIAHQLYDIALKNDFHMNSINQIQGTQNILANINQTYAQLILLDIFNAHQIRLSEIQSLYQCSFDWAKLIQILPRATTLTKYVVDCNKDYPPIHQKKQNPDFEPSFFITTQELLEHINATFGRTPEFLSKHEQKNLSLALKFHVQTILGSTTERRHDRYQYSAQLDICFSLLSAHFYLSKAKTFNETLMLENNYGFQSESKLLLNWDKDTPDTLPQVNSSRLLDREAKQLYQTSVLDVSLNGYRIKWKGETPKNLRTGEFILVKEETQEKWRGGVIRWIKQSTNKSLELGLEILAQEMYPCAVRMQIDLHTINYHPALLIQKAVFQQQVTLILPGSQTFKEHQTIYLRLGQEEIKICLTKALLITQSFIQFNFELINEQQQGLLDQFMDKQAQELNKQDLWEALK